MNILAKIALFGIFVGFSFGMIFGYIPAQVQAFKKVVQSNSTIANAANCDFRGVQDFAGLDAHGAHLPGVSFQICLPSSVNKTNSLMVCDPSLIANLTGINLANANLFSSCFNDSILDNAILTGADATNASFQRVSMKNAQVKGMVTTNSTFCNAVMPDGKVCKDTWTGQGITVTCNCSGIPDDDGVPPTDTKNSSTSTLVKAASTSTATASALKK